MAGGNESEVIEEVKAFLCSFLFLLELKFEADRHTCIQKQTGSLHIEENTHTHKHTYLHKKTNKMGKKHTERKKITIKIKTYLKQSQTSKKKNFFKTFVNPY